MSAADQPTERLAEGLAARGLRSAALATLRGWSPPDQEQESLRADYVAHLAAHADGVWRSHASRHVTASAAVIDPTGGRVLLTLHPKVGRWLQLGGHCELGDQSLAAAALREATEESGIAGLRVLSDPVNLDRHEVRCGGGAAEHLDVQHLVVAPPGATERISAESLDLRWFALDGLPSGADAAVRRLVARAAPLLAR